MPLFQLGHFERIGGMQDALRRIVWRRNTVLTPPSLTPSAARSALSSTLPQLRRLAARSHQLDHSLGNWGRLLEDSAREEQGMGLKGRREGMIVCRAEVVRLHAQMALRHEDRLQHNMSAEGCSKVNLQSPSPKLPLSIGNISHRFDK